MVLPTTLCMTLFGVKRQVIQAPSGLQQGVAIQQPVPVMISWGVEAPLPRNVIRRRGGIFRLRLGRGAPTALLPTYTERA